MSSCAQSKLLIRRAKIVKRARSKVPDVDFRQRFIGPGDIERGYDWFWSQCGRNKPKTRGLVTYLDGFRLVADKTPIDPKSVL